MFTHLGNERTLGHNLKIATLLSFVAGCVNAVGFISIGKLTTNVTGYFAFLVADILNFKLRDGLITLSYISAFFFGAFVSGFLVEAAIKKHRSNFFLFPIAVEICILVLFGSMGMQYCSEIPVIAAVSLLFAMGIQNSLVTKISNAVVRTTHLTGLFTDLGIELSQLFFYRSAEQREKLTSTIRLRLRIITFFFSGGVMGGIVYQMTGLHTLLIPAVLLLTGLLLDNAGFNFTKWRNK